MKLRLALFSFALLSLAAFFALRSAFDGDEPQPEAQHSSRWSTSAGQVQLLEQQVRDDAEDASLLARLGGLYLQRGRETGDPSFYALADDAATRALENSPEDVHALVVAGSVALARHDFARALELAERAHAINPDVNAVYAVLTDANVELGRYEAAIAWAQEMIDRRPDFASFSRASYIRELHGDIDGAVAAMERAAGTAATPFDEAWALVIVGNLRLVKGDLTAAARAYDRAALALPDDAMVLAAQARLAQAEDDEVTGEALLRRALERRPLPEYAIALGELLDAQSRGVEAEEQYALVRATQQLLAANGVEADAELVLFEADHGNDSERAYEMALSAYARRPGVLGADALAWAAFKAGRLEEALRYASEALRLGTRGPRLAYHAGQIALTAGDGEAADRLLRQALEGKALLSPKDAAGARAALARLATSRP